MSKEELLEFLKKNSAKLKESSSWQKRKVEWLRYLDELYGRVEDWVKQLNEDKLMSIEYKSSLLKEEGIGSYEVKQLLLKVGDEIITFEPKGTRIIGTKGLVHVKGKNGIVKLILADEKSMKPEVNFDICFYGDLPKDQPKSPKKKWTWKITTTTPYVKFIDLDIDSFATVVLELIK